MKTKTLTTLMTLALVLMISVAHAQHRHLAVIHQDPFRLLAVVRSPVFS